MQNQDGRVLRKLKENHKKRSTGPSRVVPHRSTTPARTCLTSLFGWEAVSQADMAALDTNGFGLNLLSSLTPCSYGEQAGMDAGGVRTVYVRLLRSQLAVEESPRCRLNGAKRSLILSRKSQFFRVESLPELSVSRFHPGFDHS